MTRQTIENIAIKAGANISALIAEDADRLAQSFKKGYADHVNNGGIACKYRFAIGAKIGISDTGDGYKVESEISGSSKWKKEADPVVVDDRQLQFAGVDVKNEEVKK